MWPMCRLLPHDRGSLRRSHENGRRISVPQLRIQNGIYGRNSGLLRMVRFRRWISMPTLWYGDPRQCKGLKFDQQEALQFSFYFLCGRFSCGDDSRQHSTGTELWNEFPCIYWEKAFGWGCLSEGFYLLVDFPHSPISENLRMGIKTWRILRQEILWQTRIVWYT